MTSPESISYGKELHIETTPIPGLLVLDLPVHGDNRGWFKENWQREKMVALGLPDFEPIQNNMSFNKSVGTTRGIHAEPWDKYVSVGTGRIFGAWVDLREGDNFGKTFTLELDPSKAIFVPRGVGNAFQVLEENTLYSYLVNDHWSPDAQGYGFLNLADETVAIDWPIPLDNAELSDKDRAHPRLADVAPIAGRSILVTGANGQLGKALREELPHAEFVDRAELDISDPSSWGSRNWRQYQVIINAAAYTKVDAAETAEGRVEAWRANAEAVKNLAKVAIEHNLTLVHISSDYVFDGTIEIHDETEPFSPLNVYGQSKAAGDLVAATVPRHYIARTTWVIGDGKNFVTAMQNLAKEDVERTVVGDQIGRLTFTKDLARGLRHLLESEAPYGTYNITNDGESVSWADIARTVFEASGQNPSLVKDISTADYFAGKEGIAPRPLQSTLNIGKIVNAGFTPRRWDEALRDYLEEQQAS